MPDTQDEQARLAALKGYGVLDTPNEAEFDDIVREAARVLGTPIALISLIDADRQWFKAKVGLEASEAPRSISFCTHAIRGPDILVVEDATEDDRFASNPLVTGDPHIRFYAGTPLKTPGGKRIGRQVPRSRRSWQRSQSERSSRWRSAPGEIGRKTGKRSFSPGPSS